MMAFLKIMEIFVSFSTETIPEINECLTQIENCFELLLPNPARFDNTDVPSNKMVSPSTKSRSATQKGGTIDSEGLSGERVKGKLKGNDGESSRHDDGEDVSDEMEEDDDEDSLEGEEEETGEEGKDASLLQQHGLPSWNYNIDIDINTGKPISNHDQRQSIHLFFLTIQLVQSFLNVDVHTH